MRIYRVLFISTVLLCLFVSSASSYILRRDIHKSVNADSLLEFRLSNKFGSVFLEGYNGDAMDITASFKIRAPSKSKAREIFKKIDFNLSDKNGKVSVETDLPRVHQTALFSINHEVRTVISIDYRVVLPFRTSVQINTLNGDINVNNMEAPFLLKTGLGDIDIKNSVFKTGRAEISRGKIRCELLTPGWSGNLDLRVGSGEISLLLVEGINAVLIAQSDKGRVELDLNDSIKPETEKHDWVKVVFGRGNGKINLDDIRGKIIVESANP